MVVRFPSDLRYHTRQCTQYILVAFLPHIRPVERDMALKQNCQEHLSNQQESGLPVLYWDKKELEI